MMTVSISDLNDIHLPEQVSWWPMAIGWWFIVAISVLVIIATIYYCRYWLNTGRFKKTALQELEAIIDTAEDDHDYLRLCSSIIRRLSITLDKDNRAVNAHGRQWQQLLSTYMPESQATLLAVSRYQKKIALDRTQLAQACRQWIKAYKP